MGIFIGHFLQSSFVNDERIKRGKSIRVKTKIRKSSDNKIIRTEKRADLSDKTKKTEEET